VKTADRGARIGRRLQHADLRRTGAMHGALAAAPRELPANRRDGVVQHREENDVRGVDHALRIAACAARDARDRVAAAR
jgi:hypothetical protein